MTEIARTEVHHRVPRCLLAAHDRATSHAELDGAAIQAWLDYEEECARFGVSADLSREELEEAIEASAVEVSWERHRLEIHAADWPAWGRLGGLETLRRYGRAWFSHLAKRRWGRIPPEQLAAFRESILAEGQE